MDVGTFNHYLTNSFLFHYRDNPLHQLTRCEEIFLSGSKLGKYKTIFKEHYGLELYEYVYAIYYIIVFYTTFDSNEHNLEMWILNTNDNPIMTPKKELFERVLNIISFNVDDGKKYSNKTIDNFYNFDLFRDKPFVRVFDNCHYIPIDGVFIENLVFNNLFYKILDIFESEKDRSAFMSAFGYDFENYVTNLTKLAVEKNSIFNYICIEEFTFKNNLKSPDIMIFDKEKNTLLSIEIKSARVLNTVSNPIKSDESIHKSQEKTKLNPLIQAYKAILKIVKYDINENINKDTKHMFLSVSMNDIPLSEIKYNIQINGINQTSAFYSMNIEAFETFLKIISSDYSYNFSQILHGYINYQDEMSIKTYLSRIIKHHNIKNIWFDNYFLNSQSNYSKFIQN